MNRSFPVKPTASLVLLAVSLIASLAPAADRKYWELSPYTIQIKLAVCDSVLDDAFAKELAAQLDERILSTLHPLWSTEIVVTEGEAKYQLLHDLERPDAHEADTELLMDKQLFLTLRQTISGVEIACREWDRSTRRWGPVMRRVARQNIMLAEDCFALLRDAFSPLANIETDPEDFSRVYLRFKGSDLPTRTNEGLLVGSGDILLPLRIRYDHTGEVLPDGIMEVPWTFLTSQLTETGDWLGEVHSGSKRPFGLRRRGRTRFLAVAVRNPPATTQVRFYPRHDKEAGLAGYEVFQRLNDDQEAEFLALTDSSGSVFVSPANVKVVTLFLRSDGQLLAKVPVPPGAKQLIEIPIADDTARLRAQAELTAFREKLIDVVARRTILIARIRSQMEAKEFDEAKKLLGELDDLPGRAQFDQDLTRTERKKSNKSSDARVQARIDRLFSETRGLLGRFLDVRQVTELHGEVNTASRQ